MEGCGAGGEIPIATIAYVYFKSGVPEASIYKNDN